MLHQLKIRVIPVALLALFCFIRGSAQIRFGLAGGLNSSGNSFRTEDGVYFQKDINTFLVQIRPPDHPGIPSSWVMYDGYEHATGFIKSRFGFSLAAVLDIKLARNLSLFLKPGIDNRGWVEDVNKTDSVSLNLRRIRQHPNEVIRVDQVNGRESYRLTYLHLPVSILFHAPLRNLQLLFGAGAYLSYGLSGSLKFHKTLAQVPDSVATIEDSVASISFLGPRVSRSAVYHANALDYGLLLETGISLRNGLMIDLTYAFGLRDVMTDRYAEFQVSSNKVVSVLGNRSRSLTLGLIYFFSFTAKP